MADYRYGVSVQVKDAVGRLPISSKTIVAYIGATGVAGVSKLGEPFKCSSYSEYLEHYSAAPETLGTLDECARAAFDVVGLSDAWFVPITDAKQTVDDIGKAADDALAAIVDAGEIPNVICAPYDSTIADNLQALAKLCDGGIADSYSAILVTDAKTETNQIENGRISATNAPAPSVRDGHVVCAYGRVLQSDGKTLPLSAVLAAMYAEQDAKNTGEIPYRSIGNLRVSSAVGLVIDEDNPIPTRHSEANKLAAAGLVTLISLGGGVFNTWGDHTSLVSDGAIDDKNMLYQFDSGARVMVHLFNRFLQTWRGVIDSPMTLALRNDVINSEQSYLDYLVSVGALIGEPRCEFRKDENAETGLGRFYFTDIYTPTMPAKYIQLNLIYSTEGLSAYVEE